MSIALLVACVVLGLVVLWLLLSAIWVAKQSLVGVWLASLPDGTDVTLQFEGTPKGGTQRR